VVILAAALAEGHGAGTVRAGIVDGFLTEVALVTHECVAGLATGEVEGHVSHDPSSNQPRNGISTRPHLEHIALPSVFSTYSSRSLMVTYYLKYALGHPGGPPSVDTMTDHIVKCAPSWADDADRVRHPSRYP
jgi:hypothetical protein